MSLLDLEDMSVLVIDNGSHTFRAGFCTDDVPSLELPTAIGKGFREKEDMAGVASKACYDANLPDPFENGQVSNWEAMENVWNFIFSKLETNPAEVPVLLSMPILDASNVSEKMTEIMFEKFQVPYVHIGLQSVLSAYSAARLSGVIVNSGHHYTDISVIYQGYLVSNSSACLNLGGFHITDQLMTKITGKDAALTSNLDSEIFEIMKEKLCYVAVNYEEEMNAFLAETFTLPDGQKVHIKEERFQCPEILFQPFLYGRDANDPGIIEHIYSIIVQSEIDLRKELYNNIVLCGGTSLLPGFQDRLQTAIANRAPINTKAKVIASVSRKYAVWLGGAVLAALPAFRDVSTSKASYEERGRLK